ncbi:MAG: hypothetical protein KA712_02180 [Myxococcales bacterium]|nr:hypothetical protein [Myxococcales bacterium]
MNATPSLVVQVSVPALAVAVTGIALRMWQRARRDLGKAPRGAVALTVIGAWFATWGMLAATGLLARFDLRPPPMMLMGAAVMAAALALGLSRIGGQLAAATPVSALIGLQAFRLPLELAMHQAAVEGVMPPQMSYAGFNFDIVTGASAALLAWASWRGLTLPRAALWAWNVAGSLLLVNVLVIAVVSTPVIAAFGTEPSRLNVWVTQFPYVYLPTILVVVAAAGHVVVFRWLLASAPARSGEGRG